jgi:hypothetical protein
VTIRLKAGIECRAFRHGSAAYLEADWAGIEARDRAGRFG